MDIIAPMAETAGGLPRRRFLIGGSMAAAMVAALLTEDEYMAAKGRVLPPAAT